MAAAVEDQVLDDALIKQQSVRTADDGVAILSAPAGAIHAQEGIALLGGARKDARPQGSHATHFWSETALRS
jgi:hypothetical protein